MISNPFSNIVNLVLLIAGAQGLLLSVLLFQKHGRMLANRLLAFMMFFYSLVMIDLMLWEIGAYNVNAYLALLPRGLPFLIAPLHYLYVKYLTQSPPHFDKKDWLHFVPYFLYRLFLMPYFFTSQQNILETVYNLKKTGLTVEETLFNWAVIFQLLIYMVLALQLIQKYSLQIKEVFSSLDKIRITWVRNITIITLVVILFFLIENVFMLAGVNVSNFFNLSAFIAAVAIYAMGYWGLLRAEIFSQTSVTESITQMQAMTHPDSHTGKYQKSGLSAEKASEYKKALLRLMKTQQPFRDSNLTLNKLADHLGITPHNLSEVINGRMNQNFFDFVNSFRVEDVKKNLDNPDKGYLTILAIGLEAGFNSKSSFNAIFKKHTGVTPSEYRSGK